MLVRPDLSYADVVRLPSRVIVIHVRTQIKYDSTRNKSIRGYQKRNAKLADFQKWCLERQKAHVSSLNEETLCMPCSKFYK